MRVDQEGMVPSTEREMSELSSEVHELTIDELDRVSGGDYAINLAVKAYEALGKRLMDAIHPPPQPTITLHF